MRKVAVLFLVIALAMPAMAQEKKKRPMGGFGMMGNPGVMMLLNADVQKDLNLSDAQKEAIKAISDNMAKIFSPDLSMEERQELGKKMAAEGEKIVKDLKEEQKTRLKQIQVQQVGPALFANAEMAKRMGLTDDDVAKIKLSDEQKEKIQELTRKLGEERLELAGGGFGRPDEATRKKIAALTKEFREKQMEVLTDDQKKAYKDLTGKPFEGDLIGGFRFGFGGGGFGKKKGEKKKDPN